VLEVVVLGPLPGVALCVPGESPVLDGPRGTVVVVECSLTVVVPGWAGIFVPEVEVVVVVPVRWRMVLLPPLAPLPPMCQPLPSYALGGGGFEALATPPPAPVSTAPVASASEPSRYVARCAFGACRIRTSRHSSSRTAAGWRNLAGDCSDAVSAPQSEGAGW
jgi:hypothetical protein